MRGSDAGGIEKTAVQPRGIVIEHLALCRTASLQGRSLYRTRAGGAMTSFRCSVPFRPEVQVGFR
jgi:hypothetical protein